MKEARSVIYAKVFPESKKERCMQSAGGNFDIFVRDPAKNNLANYRARELVAAHFGVGLSQVTIRTGHRSRRKTLVVSFTQ
jgi:uncharacterized protein YggU (UPF0235/DUF167 family)